MERYIDADKLKDAFHTDTEHLQSRDEHLFDLIMIEIDEAPTADVVDVVRCKDCKHWGCVRTTMIGGKVGNCYNDGSPFHCEQPPIMKPNDFCSYGERRTDNDL